MLKLIHRLFSIKTIVLSLLLIFINFSSVGCSDRLEASTGKNISLNQERNLTENLLEVAAPKTIQQLRSSLDQYQPQVKILSPQNDQVIKETTVQVKVQVQDLPIFKNPDLEMGPHLHVILDNEPYVPLYDLNQPLTFENLLPGTHTLRVFASRPWHESFKNEGAYTQTTFHVVTRTASNKPDPSQPLLTYSRPQGTYGAEPIMLDFYLTNTPLHLVAQENPNDQIEDWRIRVNINGQSFLLDQWQPIYLKGFKPGENWIQLEFIDQQGNPVNNVFNNTVRLIKYEPNGQDTLSKIMRGELSIDQVRGIVDPTYTVTLPETPQPSPEPVIEPEIIEMPTEPVVEPETNPEPVIETETPSQPENNLEAEITEEISPSIPEKEAIQEISPEEITEPTPAPVLESEQLETEPVETQEAIESPSLEVIEEEISQENTETEVSPKIEETIDPEISETENLETKSSSQEASQDTSPVQDSKLMQWLNSWFSRFRQPSL